MRFKIKYNLFLGENNLMIGVASTFGIKINLFDTVFPKN